MAQDKQRQLRRSQSPEIDQSVLAEAMSTLLIQAAQKNTDHPQYAEEAGSEEETSIDLVELLFYILGKIKYVILAALLGALIAGCYVYLLKTPVYQATAKLYILNSEGLSLDMADLDIGSELTTDYQEVFKTWEVHEMVRDSLGLDYGYSEMQQMLSVSNPSGTRVLYITVESENPQLATDMANAYATAAKTFIYQTMETAEPNQFSIALVPSSAVGMSKTMYVVMGFMTGLALSVVVIVLLFLLDDRPHTPDDITKTAGIPTLAVIPREQSAVKSCTRIARRKKEGKKV